MVRSLILLGFTAYTAYTSLYGGLKYLLEIPYFILNYPNVARFLIFETQNITLCLRKYHKN